MLPGCSLCQKPCLQQRRSGRHAWQAARQHLQHAGPDGAGQHGQLA